MPSFKQSHGWANWRLRQLGAAFGGYSINVAFEDIFGKEGVLR